MEADMEERSSKKPASEDLLRENPSGKESLSGEAFVGPVGSGPSCLDRIAPQKARVVDIEKKETGELIRRDCYDPDGGAAEMGDVMRLQDGALWLRVIDWARTKSHSEEVALKWEPTGLGKEEVGRIGVFTWPVGKPVRVFEE